jgi:hypothetical protein
MGERDIILAHIGENSVVSQEKNIIGNTRELQFVFPSEVQTNPFFFRTNHPFSECFGHISEVFHQQKTELVYYRNPVHSSVSIEIYKELQVGHIATYLNRTNEFGVGS